MDATRRPTDKIGDTQKPHLTAISNPQHLINTLCESASDLYYTSEIVTLSAAQLSQIQSQWESTYSGQYCSSQFFLYPEANVLQLWPVPGQGIQRIAYITYSNSPLLLVTTPGGLRGAGYLRMTRHVLNRCIPGLTDWKYRLSMVSGEGIQMSREFDAMIRLVNASWPRSKVISHLISQGWMFATVI